MLDGCVLKWAGFLEQIHQLEKIVEQLILQHGEVDSFQTTLSEKRNQLDRIKVIATLSIVLEGGDFFRKK